MTGPTSLAADVDFRRRLEEALEIANVPTLQMLCVQFSGDERFLAPPYSPTPSAGVDDNDSGGLSAELQKEIRLAAYDAILGLRSGVAMAIPRPSADQLIRMMSVSSGQAIPDGYGPMMAERFDAFNGHPVVKVTHQAPENFSVLIVGAGMSGIAAAVKLREATIPFVMVEKGSDVGGVWRQNRYPACGVDTPSQLYSYTFARGDWEHYFGKKKEIEGYFRGVAKDFGVYDSIRFDTEVIAAQYDESAHRWVTDLRRPDGTVERLRTNVLLSAVGMFGVPRLPSIEGIEQFQGQLLHTGQWDETADLAGKRVAIIGNGASAMQLAPAIVDDVASLTVFQRSKQWAVPFPKFKKRIPEPMRFLMAEVPHYEWWYRLRLAWIFDSEVYESLKVDPDWHDPQRSLNALNDGHRQFLEDYIREELGDRQDLAPRLIPDYPPYGKRMLLDNGWFRMLTRADTHLVDAGIDRIDETGIQVHGGEHLEFDVIIAASGFDIARFLGPLPIFGRGGTSIRQAWDDDDPRAYLGTVTPDFPNMFMLYGPNTGLGHGGSFMYIVECQINYVLSALDQMFDQGITEMECRREVCERYNETIQDMHSTMIWTHPGTTTWYRNSRGRVVANSPWRTTDYWAMTRSADLSDFHTASAAGSAQPVTSDAGLVASVR